MAKSKFIRLIRKAARIVITGVTTIFLTLLLLGVLALLKDHGVIIILLNLLAFSLFMYLDIYIHELGHAAAAKLMKIGVQKVIIGSGRELIRTNLFGIPLIITKSVRGGFTFMSHIEGKLLRLRITVALAAGILIQAFLTLICIAIQRFEPKAFCISRGFDVSDSFIISNVLLIGISLLPMRTRFRGIRIPNDGLNIIRTLFSNNERIREIQASAIISEAHEYFEKREYEKAADVYRKCIEQYPALTIPRINLSAALIRSLKFEEAKKILGFLIAEKHDEQYDFLVCNNLAWLLLLQNDRASLVEADKYSRMAYDLNPDVPYVCNTRGCVLIETGQIDEGVKLLKKNVYLNKPIDEEKNNPVGIFFMGYAYYLKGEKDKAKNYLTHLEGYDKLDKDDKYIFDLIRKRTKNFGEV